ncbi:response regulator transcription factor [Lutibacter flavus]|uniref:DNA-binding response regulator, OmpR family, contains REC and winged-helix (WHTH) domain n=1 Tax=Lutibacter flavus TaxID=691689 RepID=A0A238XC24_9FLAO|nr:response regulator transcription factor [Lutibacter flavus]SNR56083.1 DNA-binding response regulator, OmpR family, contains REC and winged-helix (wHTH) domain [Lutibacter flavus]
MEYKLLLVEDDASLGYLLSEYLKMKKFSIVWVKNGNNALKILEEHQFDLCILDVMMPDMDGFNLAENINQKNSSIPFLFLTARSLKIDVLKGFSLGAVDYIRKPIDEEELVVRLNNLLYILAKKNTSQKELYKIGLYTYNPLDFELCFENENWQLTSRESELLVYLLKNKNHICKHKDILTTIWGKNDYFNRKSLNVFVTRLRKLLKNDPTIKIVNIHNQGFKLINK